MVGMTRIWATIGLMLSMATAAVATNDTERKTPPSPPGLLLYDWMPDGTPMKTIRAIDAQRYTIVYQDILPRQGESGIVDIDLVLAFLRDRLSRTWNGWGVLDFEGAFIKRLRKGPGHPDHEATTASLRKTIAVLKREWPGSKWTFWGMRDVRFWIHDEGEAAVSWFSASAQQKAREFDRQAGAFSGLIDVVDWVTPWIYDIYSLKDTSPSDRMSSVAGQKAWARAKVALCRRMIESRPGGAVPLVPMFCPAFAPGGNVSKPTFVPNSEFINEVLEPTVASGVDGLALWSGMGYRVRNAFRTTVNQHQVGIRDESRARLKTLLFPNAPFDWAAPGAKAAIDDAIRARLLGQLTEMRKALNSLETGEDADTPETAPANGADSSSHAPLDP